MRGAERIVFALGALGEAGEAAAHAQRADAVAPPGQNLVRIGLMADVPDDAVARRVEQVVQRDGQLDHAEAGAEMAAGDRHGIDRLLAQFVGELAQLALVEAAEIGRRNDIDRAAAFLNRTRARFSTHWPAFKGPERRNIYRALHQKEAEAQIRLNRGITSSFRLSH